MFVEEEESLSNDFRPIDGSEELNIFQRDNSMFLELFPEEEGEEEIFFLLMELCRVLLIAFLARF